MEIIELFEAFKQNFVDLYTVYKTLKLKLDDNELHHLIQLKRKWDFIQKSIHSGAPLKQHYMLFFSMKEHHTNLYNMFHTYEEWMKYIESGLSFRASLIKMKFIEKNTT